MYKRFGSGSPQAEAVSTHIKVLSDAAYRSETEDGYSLRGVVYVRSAGPLDHNTVCSNEKVYHVVDWVCRSQRHVTRSTFAAELLGRRRGGPGDLRLPEDL